METITINTGAAVSKILLGEKLSNLALYLPKGKKTIIITDNNIKQYYSQYFNGFDVIELPTGEENKTLSTLDYIMARLVELEADRTSFIVGIGGGIVCDTTGFAASVYMRGVKFGFVSTSLLSMVDASVGGKNGVNFGGFKNMVGVFNQPEFVICDFEMLKTLPRSEYIGGFAEIIKHAAIKDFSYLEYLEANVEKALNYDLQVLQQIIGDSVRIKAAVVTADEREKGERKKLNFGHTFGHGIEKLTQMPHGEAVAIGMCLAAEVSVKKGILSLNEAQRLKQLIVAYQLPVDLKQNKTLLLNAMKKDKKREGEEVHLILLKSLGNAEIVSITYKELEGLL
jgi:3-dehydroquinate synthase